MGIYLREYGKIALLITSILFFIVLIFTVLKIRITVKRISDPSLKRMFIIFSEIFLLCFVRIFSNFLEFCLGVTKTISFLNSISESLIDTIVISFNLYWIELYFQYDFSFSLSRQLKLKKICVGVCVGLICADFILHGYSSINFNSSEIISGSTWGNLCIESFIILNTAITGLFCILKLKKVFSKKFSDIITKRLLFVISTTTSTLILRLALYLIFVYFQVSVDTDRLGFLALVMFYYVGTEIFPISLFLVYFKPEGYVTEADDDIPSMLDSKNTFRDTLKSSLVKSFLTQKDNQKLIKAKTDVRDIEILVEEI